MHTHKSSAQQRGELHGRNSKKKLNILADAILKPFASHIPAIREPFTIRTHRPVRCSSTLNSRSTQASGVGKQCGRARRMCGREEDVQEDARCCWFCISAFLFDCVYSQSMGISLCISFCVYSTVFDCMLKIERRKERKECSRTA